MAGASRHPPGHNFGGHLKTVSCFAQRGQLPTPSTPDGLTPLWLASQEGYVEVVRELLDAGAQVDASHD